ncbi:MAG: hypothetical protein ACXW3R_05910 [Rhodoplanes sp.]
MVISRHCPAGAVQVVVDCLGVPFPKSANQRIIARRAQTVAQSMIAPHNRFGHFVRMPIYQRNEEDERRILRCAACAATVFAETAGFSRTDANTVCGFCGMTRADLPFEGGDYFDVLMRVGRPLRPGVRVRRAG